MLKCKRCGRCCLQKVPYGFLYVALDKHCSQYRIDNGLGTCLIYGRNVHAIIGMGINMGIKCLSAEEAGISGLLPEDCPYAKRIPGYRSLVVNYEEAGHAKSKGERKDLANQDDPPKGKA